ncbi:MAG: glucosaminidase domain-containing protein [Desulfobulbaceae bacterium]|uniref:Glucosaminidase domain-containing protein n=1 Tax=Candidatus Desulfatifera sulfidica TaxID=2841691 RepID=A0A8J6N8V5_9BACT|nr:glucosaminidase domain-containing protein [Candidatus Desulfatifera sulfidica]
MKYLQIISISLGLTLTLILVWISQENTTPPPVPPTVPELAQEETSSPLKAVPEIIQDTDLHLSKTVPKTVQSTDLDLSEVRTGSDKKQHFFNFMRPIIEQENTRIMEQRIRLQNTPADQMNREWLAGLTKDYGVQMGQLEETRKNLLTRVDIIPLELALAQSANESSWGQSRFALEANNMFGQWCLTPGCGLIPKERSNGLTHEVTAFETVNESVRSYMLLLNSGRAFNKLRQIRQQQRNNNESIDAVALAQGLLSYSARGQDYIREIQSMIRNNQALMRPINPTLSSLNPVADPFTGPVPGSRDSQSDSKN